GGDRDRGQLDAAGDVADGVDAAHAGALEGVHDDVAARVQRHSGLLEADAGGVGAAPRGEDDAVERVALAAVAAAHGDRARAAAQAQHRVPEVQAQALLAQILAELRGDLAVEAVE